LGKFSQPIETKWADFAPVGKKLREINVVPGTPAPQQKAPLFDHLLGENVELRRDRDAKGISSPARRRHVAELGRS
jgi:hypothetical protein